MSLRGSGHTLSAGTGGAIFAANSGKLILRDITLRGDATANPDSGGVGVDTGGTLIMESGAVITGFKRGYGGVQVYDGSFYMKGGEIRGNAASVGAIGGGGGVCVIDGNAHFEKTGGIIYGNTGDSNANTTAGSYGAAVSVYDNSSASKQVLYRDATAGAGDNLSVTLSSKTLDTHTQAAGPQSHNRHTQAGGWSVLLLRTQNDNETRLQA